MKAIQITTLPPTTTKPPRMKIWAEGQKPFYTSEFNDVDGYAEAARLGAEYYIKSLHWDNVRISGIGMIPNGDYVATLEGVN